MEGGGEETERNGRREGGGCLSEKIASLSEEEEKEKKKCIEGEETSEKGSRPRFLGLERGKRPFSLLSTMWKEERKEKGRKEGEGRVRRGGGGKGGGGRPPYGGEGRNKTIDTQYFRP